MEETVMQIANIESAIEAILYAAGYPVKYESGKEITGLDSDVFKANDLFVYHAGTKLSESGEFGFFPIESFADNNIS